MKEIEIEDEIACINREIKYRQRVYPRLIQCSKMTQQKADFEIAVMKQILFKITTTYQSLKRQQELNV